MPLQWKTILPNTYSSGKNIIAEKYDGQSRHFGHESEVLRHDTYTRDGFGRRFARKTGGGFERRPRPECAIEGAPNPARAL
jgi:hypothetical protein